MGDRQTRTGETGEQIHVKGVSMWSILYSFLPYILMSVFASPSTFRIVTLVSVTISVVWLVIGLARHQGIHQLSAVGTVLFGGILVASFVDPNLDAWLKDYSGTISDAALVLTALVGMAVKHPFTLYYAKLSVDEVQWEHNPDFRAGVLAVSQAITGVWALSFAISLACDFLQNATHNNLVFGWIIPIAALVGAVKFTLWYPSHRHQRLLAEHPEIAEQHRAIAEAAASKVETPGAS